MGRPRLYPRPEDSEYLAQPGAQAVSMEPEQSGFVLSRNAGVVIRGKSHWWPAGHRFDAVRDSALIAELIRNGVTFR